MWDRNVDRDRFMSPDKDWHRKWAVEPFLQGASARRRGDLCYGPNTPRADQIGDFAHSSWIAGWCDEDQLIQDERP